MPPTVHRLGITLDDADPPVRRTLLIDPAMRLDALQRAVRAAFGWPEAGSFRFGELRGEKRDRVGLEYGPREDDEDGYGYTGGEASRHSSGDVCDKVDQRMRLLLWWGRGREPRALTIKVQTVRPAEPGLVTPSCVEAKGEAPARGPSRAEAEGGLAPVGARLRALKPVNDDEDDEEVEIDGFAFDVFGVDPAGDWLAETVRLGPADADALRGSGTDGFLDGGGFDLRAIHAGAWVDLHAEATEENPLDSGATASALEEELVGRLHERAIEAGERLPARLHVDDPGLAARLRPLERLGVRVVPVDVEDSGYAAILREGIRGAVLDDARERPHAGVEMALVPGGYNDTSLLTGYGVKPTDVKALYEAARAFAASVAGGRPGIVPVKGLPEHKVLKGMEVVEVAADGLRFHRSVPKAEAFLAAGAQERHRLAVGMLSIPLLPEQRSPLIAVRLMRHLGAEPIEVAGVLCVVDARVGTATEPKPAGGDRVRAATRVLHALATGELSSQ